MATYNSIMLHDIVSVERKKSVLLETCTYSNTWVFRDAQGNEFTVDCFSTEPLTTQEADK